MYIYKCVFFNTGDLTDGDENGGTTQILQNTFHVTFHLPLICSGLLYCVYNYIFL